MVKIRLRRTGGRNRPFYRIVVAQSTSARNGAFIENLGTYNPVEKPTHFKVDEDRALHWLLTGAQPTETMAYLLNKAGVLDRFFEQRPAAKKGYGFLDKRTASTSVKSVVDRPAESAEAAVPATEAAPPEEATAPVEAAAAQAPEAQAAEQTEEVTESESEPAQDTVEEPESTAVAHGPAAGTEAEASPAAEAESAPGSAEAAPEESEKAEQ